MRRFHSAGRCWPAVVVALTTLFSFLPASAGWAQTTAATLAREANANPYFDLTPLVGGPIGAIGGAASQLVVGAQQRSLSESKTFTGNLEGPRAVFALRLGRNDAALVELKSDAFDAELAIYSPESPSPLVDDDDGGGGTNAQLLFVRPPDDKGELYYIVVSGFDDGSKGPYQLIVGRRSAPAPAAPVRIAAGQIIPGQVGPDTPWRNSDQKLYVRYFIDGAAGQRLKFSATSNGAVRDRLDLDLEVSQGEDILAVDRDGVDARVFYRLPTAGRYEVTVLANASKAGVFQLTAEVLPEPQPPPTPQAIRPGETAAGQFVDASPIINEANNRPYALYRLHGLSGQVVLLQTSQVANGKSDENLEGVLQVQVGEDTPAGFALAAGSSSFALSSLTRQNNSRGIRVPFVRDGDVLVRVSAPASTVGSFSLRATVAPPPAPPPAAAR